MSQDFFDYAAEHDNPNPSPKQLYTYFTQTLHLPPKAAVVGVAEAAAESGLKSNAYHDYDQQGNPTGYGLWGFHKDRWDNLAQFAGNRTPGWTQQAQFFAQELAQRGDLDRIMGAQTPEELGAAGMFYERPQGFSEANPQGGLGWGKRLNYINQFLPLTQGQDVNFTPAQGEGSPGLGLAGGQPSDVGASPFWDYMRKASLAQALTHPQGQQPLQPAPQVPVTGEGVQVTPPVQGQGQTSGQPQWGALSNFLNAVNLGYGPNLMALPAAIRDRLAGQPFGPAYNTELAGYRAAQQKYQQENPIAAGTTNFLGSLPPYALGWEGLGLFGKGAQALGGALSPELGSALGTAGDVLSGTAGLPNSATKLANPLANTALRAGSLGAAGALQGELGSAVENGGWPKDWERAAGVGAATNMLLGPLGSMALSPLRTEVNPEIAQAARGLQAQEVPVYGANVAQDQGVQRSAQAALGQGTQVSQLQALTRVLASKSGADQEMERLGTKGLTPEVIDATEDKIGQKLDDIAQNVTLNFDPTAQAKLAAIRQAIPSSFISADAEKGVSALLDKIDDQIATNDGQLSGKDYQALTNSKGLISRLYRSPQVRGDPNARDLVGQLRDVLNETLETSAPPEYVGAISDARNQWKNLKLAEKVTAGSTTGIVDPNKLALVVKNYPYPLSPDVAQLGAAANLKFPRPDTQGGVVDNTPPGLWQRIGPFGHGAVGVGSVAALAEHGQELYHALLGYPLQTVGGAVAAGLGIGTPLAVSAARNAFLRSPAYTNLLLNGGLKKALPNPLIPAAVGAYGG